MLLAGDVGGTKSRFGVFDLNTPRPAPVTVRTYATVDSSSLDDLVARFLGEIGPTRIDAACIGVAGPVTGDVARLTNVSWLADIAPVRGRLGGGPARLINDLEAMASAVPFLESDELAPLQSGRPSSTGNAALIAAGTGLGEALIHNVNGRFVPAASEGGHADFAARTPRELALVDHLRRIYGRVDNERVVSGKGLVNVFRFTHGDEDERRACAVVGPKEASALAPAITSAALEGRCARCAEAVDIFIEAYGAEAGNLALRGMATAGVYIGGGIAPKILEALHRGKFIDAFRDKDPMSDMLRALPVRVILNSEAGLLGAAVRAVELMKS